MDEIISYKMCAVKVRKAKLRNYLNRLFSKMHFLHEILYKTLLIFYRIKSTV